MPPDLTLHGSLTIDVRIAVFARDIPPTCREGLAQSPVKGLVPSPSSSGSSAIFTAIRRASVRLSRSGEISEAAKQTSELGDRRCPMLSCHCVVMAVATMARTAARS